MPGTLSEGIVVDVDFIAVDGWHRTWQHGIPAAPDNG
jgi:hypothetical protein